MVESSNSRASLPVLSKLWIKICGLTRNEDACAAVEYGANALGAVFYPPSKRAITVADLASVFADVPDSVDRVALFVNPERQQVQEVIDSGHITRLQFHGDEDEAWCASFALPYYKAIRVRTEAEASAMISQFPSAELILLDAFDEKVAGGTGKTFDWGVAARLVAASPVNIALAGGLNPDNVPQAINQVRAFGVDVSSGVESAPGMKDHGKLKQFIASARQAMQETGGRRE